MKQILITLIISTVATPALAKTYLGEWTCIATNIRAYDAEVESRLVLDVRINEDVVSIHSLVGHVVVSRSADNISVNNQYYSVFASKQLPQNLNYKPRVYKNYIQFKNIQDAGSNSYDGGNMNGELVIHKDIKEDKVDNVSASYIFQSGDHLGGTIDYECQRD